MSKLSDEQLREWRDRYPDQPYAELWSGKELITELLTLRAERAKPTQSDEELWLKHVDMAYHGDIDDPDTVLITRSEFHAYLASIRAEATLAETERCAKVAEREAEMRKSDPDADASTINMGYDIAAAIRRKP